MTKKKSTINSHLEDNKKKAIKIVTYIITLLQDYRKFIGLIIAFYKKSNRPTVE